MLRLSHSEKDYLEAIYVLKRERGSVRCIDIAHYMEHSKPSVTNAVSNLIQKGYIIKEDGDITFTDAGKKEAEIIYNRHCILTHALENAGVDEDVANKDAQQIERVISNNAIDSIAKSVNCRKWVLGSCKPGCNLC